MGDLRSNWGRGGSSHTSVAVVGRWVHLRWLLGCKNRSAAGLVAGVLLVLHHIALRQRSAALECNLFLIKRTKNMTRLILLTLGIAMTSAVYAVKDIDRGKHNYYCYAVADLKPPKKVCKGIEKGDLLDSISTNDALLYCDKDELILQARPLSVGGPLHSCVYNGRETRESKRVR